MNKKHLVTFGKSSKGRIEGANALKSRLLGNKMKDGTYKPAIYFFSNCIHAIRTIPMLAHDKSKPETYDTNGEDHCCDSVVYAALSRPWTPAKPKTADNYDHWEQERSNSAWSY